MKKISNWLLGIWMSVCTALQFWPDALLQVWNMMPEDLKSAIPPLGVKIISYSILVLSFLGKMHVMRVKQVRLEQKVQDASQPEEVKSESDN